MRVGDRWARLKCIAEVDVPHKHEWPGGGFETWIERGWQIRCECGNEIVIEKKKFEGKRRYRDCGKCGSAKYDGKVGSMSFSLPLELRLKLETYAEDEWAGNRSAALVRLLKWGFEVLEHQNDRTKVPGDGGIVESEVTVGELE